jgi:dextransucrase
MVDQSKPLYRADAIPNNSIYAVYNQAYDTSSKSFEHLDNFLTADSWYRPKQILKDGKNWTASTEKDYRPLLMTWWPDKVTQVNYLNYMSQQGFGNKTYTTDMMSYDLAAAAETVQQGIEERIGREGNTTWLRQLMSDFIKTQPDWNSESEDNLLVGKDHLQGGALTFLNNSATSHANSDFRLMNRTPTNQTGTRKYHIDRSNGGYELLLANDIDNSNLAVQAEQLNWLHYIMNIGSILGNDPSANFDGVRIDAVDNVDADLLQIASDYFKEKYRVADNEANAIAHLSILEAWSYNDHQYNKDTKGAQLSIDNPLRETLLTTFLRKSNYRGSLERVITNSLNNRSSEQKHTPRDANYIFVRAHDSEVQAVLANIISKQINPKTDGFTFTMDELKQAFEIYNADMRKADKKYTQYNIPAAYATMLTNKDSITRVYYGDLFTDDGQYMAEKSPYYNAIDALLRARIKYVAGGQDMKVTKLNGYEIMSSVRYGKGAEEANQLGTAETRNQGMLVLTANRPDMKLGTNDRLVVNMGAAHKNQAYRPLLLSKSTGLATYLKDSDVPAGLVRYTDNQGNLTFTADDITGHSTVEVSGYLAVWVPVGASENQDARTKASTTKKGEQVFESSAALDSQVIYEGFSNFQDFVKTPSQYTNRVIAQNAKLFKEWGITSFEFAPQYVSSQDGTFLDSIIENGYAFEDRYDIAMSKNNKYGSLKDLMDSLRALHAEGISAIADWVPDQIYNLPGKEVVTASRTNSYGTPRPNAEIYNSLYAAKTRTFGNDFQGKYGGAFLDELKAKYPAIFERVQISNGRKLTTNEKITQWSAKYFNGSNIQGTGARYVLQDNATNQYFSLKAGQTFLPKQMTEITATGFRRVGDKVQYLSIGGYLAKNTFIQVGANQWYYFDKNGNMVTGEQVIDGKKYFFLDSYVMSFAKAMMVTSITTILKGFRPLMDSMTLRVLAKTFAISMATVKCIVASTTCMAQPFILMRRLVFKPKTSSSVLRTDARVISSQIQEISQSTDLRKILRTRLGITSIATVML